MKYIIDKTQSQPIYLQIYFQIKEDILHEHYTYGQKLPSKRQLAFDTQTSVITIERVYSMLAEEGYIESRQRSGYFVIYKQKDWFFNPDTKEEMHIQYSCPQDTISYNVLSKTMRKVMNDYGNGILVKSPNLGCFELKKAISNYLMRNRGMEVDSSQIVIGSGSEYLYGLIAQMLGMNRIYALEDPSYEKIRKVYKSNGIRLEMLKMGKDGIQSQALNSTRATVLHVTPYNSYPTGITASISKRKEYVHFANERHGFVIEDDYASEFVVSSSVVETIFSLEPNESVIYMNTFSKTTAPSLRVSYMILPKNRTKELLEKIRFYSCTVPTFEQYVIAELLNNGSFERHINKIRRKNRRAL